MKQEHDKKEGTMTQYECERVMNDGVFLHNLSVLNAESSSQIQTIFCFEDLWAKLKA